MDYYKGIDHDKDVLFVDKLLIHLIWTFWIIQQVFLLIILLNFVIALVNASYSEVMDSHV